MLHRFIAVKRPGRPQIAQKRYFNFVKISKLIFIKKYVIIIIERKVRRMKLIVYLFCIVLCFRFVWSLVSASKSKNADEFVRRLFSVAFDGVMIILFAIIEKGRW